MIDAVCFAACALVGFEVIGVILALPPSQAAPLVSAIKESLVFVPALVPGVVLVAGVLFELSASSKFASSDSINWLPVTQAEYVAASTISVAYAYSVVPSVIMGVTLGPAFRLGYGGTWVEMLLLSCVSLFYGGAIVEILRAAINRVSNVVMGRARRGALVLRLAATIGMILIVEVVFNFVFLIDLVGTFTSALNAVAFLPVLWASLAVRASIVGDTAQNVIYSVATVLKAAVEQLSMGDAKGAIQNLSRQGRVHEIVERDDRIQAIARAYAEQPANTLVISPDNESRMEIAVKIHRGDERNRKSQPG